MSTHKAGRAESPRRLVSVLPAVLVRPLRPVLPAALLAVVALWLACSEGTHSFCADPGVDPTIENIWPSADGTYWDYEIKVKIWADPEGGSSWFDSLYQTAEEVPPLPTLDHIERLLRGHDVGDPELTQLASYRLEFAGDTTSSLGVVGQNLREILSYDAVGEGAPARPAVGAAARPGGIDPLLARVYAARPDLRAAIEGYLSSGLHSGAAPNAAPGGRAGATSSRATGLLASGCFQYPCPTFIHGGVWRKTDQAIVTYGDLDTKPAWKFLEADLSEDHEFTHQLVPALAGNIFLHCRVSDECRVRTEMCVFRHALECVYLLDYGVQHVEWPVTGYHRKFDYGRVLYVPTVGPVYVYERLLVSTGEPLGIGIGERTTSLKATGTSSR